MTRNSGRPSSEQWSDSGKSTSRKPIRGCRPTFRELKDPLSQFNALQLLATQALSMQIADRSTFRGMAGYLRQQVNELGIALQKAFGPAIAVAVRGIGEAMIW